MRLHSSCISGIANRTKTLSLESLANKDAICKSDNTEKAVVRYTCSTFVGVIIAESEATGIYSLESILLVGCSSMLGIKRIEGAQK